MRKRTIIIITLFTSLTLFLGGCGGTCVREGVVYTPGQGYVETCVEYADGSGILAEPERKEPMLDKYKSKRAFKEASVNEPHAVINLKYEGYKIPGETIFLIDGKKVWQFCFLPPHDKFGQCSFRIAPGKHMIEFQVYWAGYGAWETEPWKLTRYMEAGKSYDLILSREENHKKPHRGFNFRLVSK